MTLQDPSDFDAEKRFLLVLLLSTAILLASPFFLKLIAPEEAAQEAQRKPAPTEAAQPLVAEPLPPPAEVEEAPETVPTKGDHRAVEVRGEDLALRFDTAGAVIESAQLTKYNSRLVEGAALELIPQGLPPSLPRPFALVTGDAALDAELAAAVYEVEGAGLGGLRAPAELTFRYRSPTLQVVRRVKIPARGYQLEWSTEVQAGGRPVPFSLVLGPGIGRVGFPEKNGGFFAIGGAGDFVHPRIAYFREGSVTRVTASEAEAPTTIEGGLGWVAFDSQYFAYAVWETEPLPRVRLREEKLAQPEGAAPANFAVAEVGLRPGAPCQVYLGPKDLDVLKTVEPTLTQLVDYGWFSILVEPLLFVLKLIYRGVGNYGWAIIILTFLINLALLPIRYKQVVSMKKMGALQPKMKAIQERYKKLRRDDPARQEMNREIMALYQEHGVNPLGGCLPLLIQMPFLLAFYRMLASSIELRGAPFMLWIQDLSQHDPYYVTPIASGLVMVAQQKMTPTGTADPMQRKMMMIMPVMLTYFFLWVSSGLAIYFFFSTLFGVLFQWGIQKMEKDEEKKPSSKPKKKSRKGKAS